MCTADVPSLLSMTYWSVFIWQCDFEYVTGEIVVECCQDIAE